MKIEDGVQRPRRRMNLTPMIDVVFLLLVFFMMVSRFGGQHGLPLQVAGQGGADWVGPPRLIDVTAEGARLNGAQVDDLVAALTALMSAPDDPVILRSKGADVQALVAVMEELRGAGLTHLVLVP